MVIPLTCASHLCIVRAVSVQLVRKRKEKGGEKEDEVSERTPEPEGEVDRWDCNYFTKVVNFMEVIIEY